VIGEGDCSGFEAEYIRSAVRLEIGPLRPGAIPARSSRHYYDLYKLSESPIRSAALSDLTLLKSVVEFKERFYYSSWARYDLAIPGSFRLSPPDSQLPRLKGTTVPCATCSTGSLQHLKRFWPDWRHWNGKSTLRNEPADRSIRDCEGLS
jgi:hypothetical protein